MTVTGKNPELVYENTVRAEFVRRLNRFTAEVVLNGKTETVHVKNTGRLGELLLPGAEVTLQKAESETRKTPYDLISVYSPALKWVNIDSLAPNALLGQEFRTLPYDLIRPEFSYGESRIDFYMERGGEKYLTEVKGCTLAADPQLGTGLFPDAPTERGVKHLKELAAAAGKGYHCTIAFVITMNGIRLVLPNEQTQPEFGQALREAVRAGVHVVSYSCHVEADRVKLAGMTDDTARYLQDGSEQKFRKMSNP